ncbi:hypothetical protein IFT59_13030 [Rhizobium sp. CFBP 8752]|uniref:hypothetical protein n=1 Tax=Rhizobium sp. CFBP 8752 TaxID=2775301 RepID=UPI0017819849|nr:hypothetical protein [Rhizobium sp. CFBP 8752]MBD8664172.1 hypothetical protein [Rhizobium sp. CFBP 8752]
MDNSEVEKPDSPAVDRARDNIPARRALPSALFGIGLLTALGGVAPLALLGGSEPTFTAHTQLKVGAIGEQTVSAAIGQLLARTTIDNLIHALNLGKDSSFATEPQSVTGLLYEIVSGTGTTTLQDEAGLRDRLTRAITISYDRITTDLRIAATAGKSEEARQIVGMLGNAVPIALSVGAVDGRDPAVEALRDTLGRAEAALSGFVSRTGKDKVAELKSRAAEMRDLTRDVEQTESDLAALNDRLNQASAMKVADVLNKPLPDSLDYTGLEYQRQRHVEAQLSVDQLSSDLGPLHPRYQAAEAVLAQARNSIQDALKQLVKSLNSQKAHATTQLAELRTKLDQFTADKTVSDEIAKLSGLETAVAEARDNYSTGRFNSPGSAKPAAAPRVQISKPLTVTPNEAPATVWLGLPWYALSGLGAFAGLLLGAAGAMLIGRRPSQEPAVDHLDTEHDHIQTDDVEDIAALPMDARWAADLDLTEDPEEIAAAYEYDHGPGSDAWAQDVETYPVSEDYWPEMEEREAANGLPLSAQLRELLMANRQPYEEAAVPALLSAAISDPRRHAMRQQELAYSELSHEDRRTLEELQLLRQEMIDLRDQVQTYSELRTAARR